MYYREHKNVQPITYQVAIGDDQFGRPYVLQERLRQRRKGQKYGEPYTFLRLDNGSGVAWKGNQEGYQKTPFESIKSIIISTSSSKKKEKVKKIDIKKGDLIDDNENSSQASSNLDLLEYIVNKEADETEIIKLEDPRKLGIATLGALKQHPRISAFRRFIEGWFLSYFTPDAARNLQFAGPQEHLNIQGDNLRNVAQFMEREYPQRFQVILKKNRR